MNSGNFTFRMARYKDAVMLASCARDLVETGLPWTWTPPRIIRQISDPNTTALIAEYSGQFAGFAIMSFASDKAHLNLLAVTSPFQGMGLGRRIMNWLEKSARVAGIEKVLLEVRAGNNAARAFYRRLGFREVAYKFGYYQGVETAVRMCRQLAPEVDKKFLNRQINAFLENLTKQSH